MTEQAKAKRDEQAEQHARSYDPAGFYKNLPPGIANTKDDFKAGFDAGYAERDKELAHLSAQAGEFDLSYAKEISSGKPQFESDRIIKKLIEQHEQMSATIGALREQLREKEHPTFTKTIAGFHADLVIAENNVRMLNATIAEQQALLAECLVSVSNLIAANLGTPFDRELLVKLKSATAKGGVNE